MRQLLASSRLLVIVVCFAAIAPNIAASPEPALLTQPLYGPSGTKAGAVFVDSRIETSVVMWPGTWKASSTIKAGTPCSTGDLFVGDQTTKTIEANGGYRRCIGAAPAPVSGPEPARLGEPLSGDNGTQAAAVFVNSGTQTSVVKWPDTLTPDTTLAAGMRCSSADLASGEETARIIQVNGDYRKCIDASALSPEPARITEALSGHGTQVVAVFVNNGLETSVVRWPGTWMSNATLQAGTPCSTVDLADGQQTAATIQATGNYRKCM